MRYDSKRDYNVTLLIKTPEKHVLYKFLNPSDKKTLVYKDKAWRQKYALKSERRVDILLFKLYCLL